MRAQYLLLFIFLGTKIFYHHNKTDFVWSKYLNIREFPLRSSLTKLLISAHDLEIERGRYVSTKTQNSTSRENRLCRYCKEVLNIEEVESELHVLDYCLLYSQIRIKLGNKLNKTDTDSNFVTVSLNTYLKNNDEEKLFNIANFCKTCFEHRMAFMKYLDSYND